MTAKKRIRKPRRLQVYPDDMKFTTPGNGIAGPAVDPFRVTMNGRPSDTAVLTGILMNDHLRREIGMKLLLLHREELDSLGAEFTETLAGYLDRTKRPWANRPWNTTANSNSPTAPLETSSG